MVVILEKSLAVASYGAVGSDGFFFSYQVARLVKNEGEFFSKRNSSPALRNFGVKPYSHIRQNKRAAGCGAIARIVSVGIS
jgi:hypothetical protein